MALARQRTFNSEWQQWHGGPLLGKTKPCRCEQATLSCSTWQLTFRPFSLCVFMCLHLVFMKVMNSEMWTFVWKILKALFRWNPRIRTQVVRGPVLEITCNTYLQVSNQILKLFRVYKCWLADGRWGDEHEFIVQLIKWVKTPYQNAAPR